MNISPIKLEAGDFVVVTCELSEIADDEKTPRLNRIGNGPSAVADFVFQVVSETITSEFEGSFLRLRYRSRDFI